MTIQQLIEWTTDPMRRGFNRSAGAWSIAIVYIHGARVARLYHHGTMMLAWDIDFPQSSDKLDWSLGWGSVSDQNGMNVAFRVLDLPYYYSRKGGAHIISLNDRNDVKGLPVYVRRSPELHLGRARGALVTQ